MRRQENLVHFHKWMVMWQRLLLKHVKCSAGEFPGGECRHQRRGIDYSPTRDINQKSAGLHFVEGTGIHEMFSILSQWAMQGEEIGFAKHSIQIGELDRPEIGRGLDVIPQYTQSQRRGHLREPLPNSA